MLIWKTQKFWLALVASFCAQNTAFAVDGNQPKQLKADQRANRAGKDNNLRAAQLISLASAAVKSGNFSNARQKLFESRAMSSDPLISTVWNSVSSELSEAEGRWADAGFFAERATRDIETAIDVYDRRNGNRLWNPAVRELVFRALNGFLLAGLPLESLAMFERYRAEIGKEFLNGAEGLALKRLSDELRRVDRLPDALNVENVLFRFYPFVAKELIGKLTPDLVCRLDAGAEGKSDARSRATMLIQRFGSRPDLTGYAQALAGVPEALAISRQNPDSLSFQVRSDLLDTVEWLQSVRDYRTALEITDGLVNSRNFEAPFTKERLIMIHARNLNGVHRPVEAAQLYKDIIQGFPQTESANTARPRYVMSLHYAGRYEDVAREAVQLSGVMRQRDMLWRTFWAHYLSKNYSSALNSTSRESGQEQRARFQYWRGRAHEQGGRKQQAVEIFKSIAGMDGSNHYALFADWRMQKGSPKSPALKNSNIALRAKSLSRNADIAKNIAMLRSKPRVESRYEYLNLLAEAGYGETIKAPLRKKLQTLSGSGTPLAEFLVQAGDAHAAVQFALGQRKGSPRIPIGKTSEWKNFVAKNSQSLSLLYPVPYRQAVADAAESFGVSPWLVLSIMRAESSFQPQVVSNVGARGLMQIMPSTGERIAELLDYPDFEPSHLDRPEVSIAFGAWYLARLMDYYQGELTLAIAAYNAGPEAVDRWLKRNGEMILDEFLEDIPFDQTRKYVATVLTNMEIYTRLHSKGQFGVAVDLSSRLPTPRNEMEMF